MAPVKLNLTHGSKTIPSKSFSKRKSPHLSNPQKTISKPTKYYMHIGMTTTPNSSNKTPYSSRKKRFKACSKAITMIIIIKARRTRT